MLPSDVCIKFWIKILITILINIDIEHSMADVFKHHELDGGDGLQIAGNNSYFTLFDRNSFRFYIPLIIVVISASVVY